MCHSIKPLFHNDSLATEEEIQNASLQFVRKVSGFRKPSKVNKTVFDQAVQEIGMTTQNLLNQLHKKKKQTDD